MTTDRMIGHYRIIERLGSGAMGTVHVGLDTYIDRPVAIKSLRPELSQDPEFVSRFRAEAKSLARLNHPNIATLFSPILEDDNLYLVMELVRGKELDDILRDRGKPLGVKESLAIVAQTADGLAYAHEMGVIHRDIKPSNLMIANDGRVKVMDFGIARVQGSVRLTRSGTAVGTPLYMSPEQCKGGEGDERSDIYSLAIVLYEMLSGAPPFSGQTEYDLIQAQIKTTPAALVPRVAGVTPALESAIMVALSKRPEQRFPTMRAFSDAIGATVLRPDATIVVRNATHLIEAPTVIDAGSKSQTGALDIAKSRVSSLTRGFKARGTFGKGLVLIVALAAIAAPACFLLGVTPAFMHQGNPQRAIPEDSSTSAASASSRSGPAPGESPSHDQGKTFAVAANPSSQDAAPAVDYVTQLDELRTAIKGTAGSRIKAPDFDYVNNGVKVQLLRPAKTLADAGIAEAQFVLGMLLLETPEHIDIESSFDAFSKAAQQDYPDAQVNLALLYQGGSLGIGRNLEKASYWFEKAAGKGNAKAAFWLGCYYQYGWGGRPKDISKSIEKYGQAIAGNYDLAKQSLEAMTNNASTIVSPCLK